MIYIGNHLSSSGGFEAMGKAALKLGADTFAFFTRNPRGGQAKDIYENDAKALIKTMQDNNFGPLVAHAPYTMNLCSDKPDIREFAKNMLIDDVKRMEYLPGNFYNFHPGSHVGQGVDETIPVIANALNEAMFDGMNTKILLETMAGKGSEIGRSFEEIARIIDLVNNIDNIGVCMDSCHIWDGGYDIDGNLDGVFEEFDRIIGLDKLYAVHINDSMNPFGSHKDRHAKIGEGCIGEKVLKQFATHKVLAGKPFILETPNDDEGYKKEIALIRSWF